MFQIIHKYSINVEISWSFRSTDFYVIFNEDLESAQNWSLK